MSAPNPIIARLGQVAAMLRAGRIEQAKAACARIVQSAPKDPGANAMMAQVLARAGAPEQALFYAQRASDLLPDEAELLVQVGHLLGTLGRGKEAIAPLERAVALDPVTPNNRVTLASIYANLSRFTDARDVCGGGLARTPDDPNLIASYAHGLLNTARIEECVKVYTDAAARDPNNLTLAANLCNALNYMPGVPRDDLFAAHKRFGEVAFAVAAKPTAVNSPRQCGPLRVGVISPDLRRHSVAAFVRAFFVYHDRARVALHVYATGRADDVTAELRPHARTWRDVSSESDLRIAELIRSDRVDLLIDLAGHTAGHSLAILALKPAPVQITYLGYPHTTGLPTVDFRIVDSITDPAPDADPFAVEKLLRLDPCFLCWRPPRNAPPPSPPPSQSRVHITFGSFNTAQKLNTPLLALWSRLLSMVPDSRLVLKATNFADSRLVAELTERIIRAGISRERFDLLSPRDTTADHLGSYSLIDIALDPLPYHGTTTTCEALFMGVPVVTLAGDRHATRVGASLLSAVGAPELIARDEDDYLHIAASLARSADKLASYRANLRPMLERSPLRDEHNFARRFDSMLFQAFTAKSQAR